MLLSANTARGIRAEGRELGEYEFKGLRAPERVFQLVGDGLPSEFPPLRDTREHAQAVRAVIAEDSTLFREGLARLLAEGDQPARVPAGAARDAKSRPGTSPVSTVRAHASSSCGANRLRG